MSTAKIPLCSECGGQIHGSSYFVHHRLLCPRCYVAIAGNIRTQPDPLQSVITWIPVSDRLPEDGRTKLIICGPYIVTAWWNQKLDAWKYASQIWDAKHVTHWAELPAPPAGEKGDG